MTQPTHWGVGKLPYSPSRPHRLRAYCRACMAAVGALRLRHRDRRKYPDWTSGKRDRLLLNAVHYTRVFKVYGPLV